MRKLIGILFAAVLLSGCAGARMSATSSCTFSPSVREGRYTTWINPGDAKCSFTLAAPIGKAEDAKIFADAFVAVMGSAPQIEIPSK